MGTSDKTRSSTKTKNNNPHATSVAASSATLAPSHSSSKSQARTLSTAFHTVRRKASRLSCTGDKVDSSVGSKALSEHEKREGGNGHIRRDRSSAMEARVKATGPVDRSSSKNSSASGSVASTNGGRNSSRVLSPSSSAATSVSSSHKRAQAQPQSQGVFPGPILSPSELAKALSRTALVSPPSNDASPARQASDRSLAGPVTVASRKSRNIRPLTIIPTPVDEIEDPVSVPLSPPPHHFKTHERVDSESGPYTTPSPVNSPPASPRLGQLRLDSLISSESLVAPRPAFYSDAPNTQDNDDDCRSIKSDFGAGNTNVPSFARYTRFAPVPGDTSLTVGRAKRSVVSHGGFSTTRAGQRMPMHRSHMQSENGNESLALRRVFSR